MKIADMSKDELARRLIVALATIEHNENSLDRVIKRLRHANQNPVQLLKTSTKETHIGKRSSRRSKRSTMRRSSASFGLGDRSYIR